MTVLTPIDCRDMMLTVCGRIIENEKLLNELDGAAGDGDHGSAMAQGFSAAKSVLDALEPFDVNEVFRRTGMALLSEMDGASSVVFSSMMLGGVMSGSPALKEFDGRSAAALFRRSLEVIKACGGAAKVGGKTMIDALEPAVAAMETCGGDIAEVFAAAAAAAAKGFEATRDMRPVRGVTRTFYGSGGGHPDAGAKSVALVFAAMRDFTA